MDEAKQPKATSRRKLVKWIVLCLTIVFGTVALYGLFLFVSGYRLTPLQAAKANTDVPGSADLVRKVDLGWGECYLLQTPDQFFMAECERDGFLWRCQLVSIADKRPDDGLTTLAYLGFGPAEDKRVTIFAVQSSDPEVAYVEAGEGPERVRQATPIGTAIVFQWTHTEIWTDDLAAHALSADGRLLYEYRHDGRALWYPVDDPSEAWYPIDETSAAN